MKTTVYLIRHSVRINTKDVIESWKTSQDKVLRSEKIILSVTGEKRAEILSNEEELQNIDVVYASNCVRTLQTAKYLMEKQNLKANLDERLDERRTGKPNLLGPSQPGTQAPSQSGFVIIFLLSAAPGRSPFRRIPETNRQLTTWCRRMQAVCKIGVKFLPPRHFHRRIRSETKKNVGSADAPPASYLAH